MVEGRREYCPSCCRLRPWETFREVVFGAGKKLVCGLCAFWMESQARDEGK